jgi:hypothetical protein
MILYGTTYLSTRVSRPDVVRGGIVAVADKCVYPADLLKNKSRPEAAAEGAATWVVTERELREKLKKEREAKKREQEKEVRHCEYHVKVSAVDLCLLLYIYRRRRERKRKAKQRSPRLRLRLRKKRPRRMIR